MRRSFITSQLNRRVRRALAAGVVLVALTGGTVLAASSRVVTLAGCIWEEGYGMKVRCNTGRNRSYIYAGTSRGLMQSNMVNIMLDTFEGRNVTFVTDDSGIWFEVYGERYYVRENV